MNEFWSSGVPNFVFSFQGKGGKREADGGAMGNFCLRCFSGLRPAEISFHAPSNPSMTKMPSRKVGLSLSLAEQDKNLNNLFAQHWSINTKSADYSCESIITR